MLCYLESLDSSIDDLQSVRVVRDYPDVFEEVKGLPPKREIDFRIYLVDNAKTVSLPVRHMAPVKGESSVSKSRSCLRRILLGEAFLNGVLRWYSLLRRMVRFVYVLIIES